MEGKGIPQSHGPELNQSSWTDPAGPIPQPHPTFSSALFDNTEGCCANLHKKPVESAGTM